MSTEITVSLQRDDVAARMDYAKALSVSDILPKAYIGKPGNVLVAVEAGMALGLPPIQAINGINVINNRPALSADLMAAIVRKAGHKLRVREEGMSVTATLIRCDDPDYEYKVVWDQAKAQQAKLWGKAGPWTDYPTQMLRSRAISEVCRQGASDALFGFIYTPDEVENIPASSPSHSSYTPPPARPAHQEAAQADTRHEPAPTQDAPVETGEAITPDQVETISAYIHDLQLGTLAPEVIRDVVGRPASSRDMTRAEAEKVIAHFEDMWRQRVGTQEELVVDAEVVE